MKKIPKDKRIVGDPTDEALRGLHVAFDPMRDELYRKIAPITGWLNDVIMFCTLYMDKRKMGRKRRRWG